MITTDIYHYPKGRPITSALWYTLLDLHEEHNLSVDRIEFLHNANDYLLDNDRIEIVVGSAITLAHIVVEYTDQDIHVGKAYRVIGMFSYARKPVVQRAIMTALKEIVPEGVCLSYPTRVGTGKYLTKYRRKVNGRFIATS